jgi:hypothetical protein
MPLTNLLRSLAPPTMNVTLTLFALPLLAAGLSAQASVAVTALTPITTSASVGGAPSVQALPVGPLASSVLIQSLPSTTNPTKAVFACFTHETNESVLFACSMEVRAEAAQASASVAPAELLVSITAPVPTGALIEIVFNDQTQAGSPQPRIDVDIFNDGSVDFVSGTLIVGLPPIAVGPQPLDMRVILDAQAAPFQRSSCSLSITVRPLTGISTWQTAQGCAPVLNSLVAVSSFVPNAVHIRRPSIGSNPLLVLGLNQQPTLFPSAFGFPCLLVPSPDAVLSMPMLSVDLVIPQAVRPLAIQVQAAGISQGQLALTDAFAIFAN